LAESARLGLELPDLELVTVSSEPVSDELIETTRRQWGARVLSTYSSNELGAIALSAPDGGYAVMAESVYVEVLDDAGRPCRQGEIGRVVVSTLQDMLRPLLRYETGDYAEVGVVPTNSPITLPRLSRIAGRERTMIRLPDGRRIWPYFEFGGLTRLERLKNWQLVQRRDASLCVRLVLTGELDDELRDSILSVVNAALPGLAVSLEQVTAIERTRRGKFLEVTSELD
jgi:phenylacetate-CoA ligase